MSKKIPLQNGMFAIVDDVDYEKVNKYNWWLAGIDDNKGNVYSDDYSGERLYLKYFIYGRKPKENKVIFQRNLNWLDFTKENLVEVDVSTMRIMLPG